MNTITAVSTLTTIVCPECAGVYAISDAYKAEALKVGAFKHCWTCPYCKTERGFGESAHEKEVARLKQEAANERYWKERAEKNVEYHKKESEHFRKSRDGMKGQLVKVRTRLKNGACPCCNRTFVDLQRHMACKHPNFTPNPTPEA